MKTYYLQLDFSSIYSLFVVWPLKRGLFLVAQRSVKILTAALDNNFALLQPGVDRYVQEAAGGDHLRSPSRGVRD